MHIQVHIVRRELLRSRIQVEVPLHVHLLRRRTRSREISGEISRGPVRNAMPEKFSVVSRIFRRQCSPRHRTSGSKKYFCANLQLIHSRLPHGSVPLTRPPPPTPGHALLRHQRLPPPPHRHGWPPFPAQKQPLRCPILHLIGVAHNIHIVEPQQVRKLLMPST